MRKPISQIIDSTGLFGARGTAVAARYAKKVNGCVVCGGVALTRVGAKGYCKEHRAEALRHVKALGATLRHNIAKREAMRDAERIDE